MISINGECYMLPKAFSYNAHDSTDEKSVCVCVYVSEEHRIAFELISTGDTDALFIFAVSLLNMYRYYIPCV